MNPVIQNTPYTQSQNAQNAPGNANSYSTLADTSATPVPSLAPPSVSPASTPTPIAADGLGQGTNPVSIPGHQVASPLPPASVPAPAGTTTSADGSAAPTPSATGSSTDTQSWIKTQLASLGGLLGGKAAATTALQNSTDLAGKTTQATADYNTYNKAKLDLAQQITNLQSNSNGMTASGVAATVADAQRKGNANLANLAVIAQSSQGLLDAAQKTITDKINAQFQPIADQIDFLTKFSQVNNNDLSDSEKFALQNKIDEQKTASAGVQTAASDIHQTLLKNNAPASAYSAVDSITEKYISGQLTAPEAQSQMYAAAGKYTAASQNASYTPGANPVVDSHIQNVLSGNETMAQVPANLRNAVSVGLTQQPAGAYSPIAASRFTTAASRITSQFTDMAAYKLTADGQTYLQRIDAAIKTPGSISDQDLLDSLTKLNTGGNAISDAQVKLVTDGKSFSDIANTYKNKFENGGVLSDSQRNQIQTIAKAIFANYQKSYQPVYEQASKQLTAAGIPKAFWTIPDLNALSGQSGTGNASASTGATVQSNGNSYTVGQVYNDGKSNWTVDASGKWTKQ